jgi:acyl carrier protein
MDFVPDVQELLGIRVPLDDWERVQNVSDVIDLLREHRDEALNNGPGRCV